MSIIIVFGVELLYGDASMNKWARPELNWRSSPCQGDVIAPRPRALNAPNKSEYLSESVPRWNIYETILDILPVQPG